MALEESKRGPPPGLVSGLLFFAVVAAGSSYIVISKVNDFSAFNVTAVPVLIMIGYAIALGIVRLFRLRDDQSGDNLYYMGFLFTLTSLAVSLYQFTSAGSAEQIVQNFGIAIASTIAGITLRILFNQMRRDPVEVEATARLELAQASRKVKRELESTVLELGYFRRMAQQSATDALDEMRQAIGGARERFTGEMQQFAAATTKSLEQAPRKPDETVGGLSGKMVGTLEAASEQLALEGERLATSTASIVKALDGVVSKLASLQTPDHVIENKLAPMILGLARVVDTFSKSAEMQALAIDTNLKQTHDVVVAIAQLMQEIRTAKTARFTAGPIAEEIDVQPATTDIS